MTTIFVPDAPDFVYPDTWVQRYGGRPAYGYAVTAGALPLGLALNPATRHVTGTVDQSAAPGVYNFTITLTDGLGRTTSRAYAITVQAKTLGLDARSPNLLATPQPFPLTAAALLAALGSPAGWTDANVRAIYGCAEVAGNLADALALAADFSPFNGPLYNRECVGLAQAASFTSKRGIELIYSAVAGSNYFSNNDVVLGNIPDNGSMSWLAVLRPSTSNNIATDPWAFGCVNWPIGYDLEIADSRIGLWAIGTGVGWGLKISIPFANAAQWVCMAMQAANVGGAGGATDIRLLTSEGDGSSLAMPGSFQTAANFQIGTNAAAAGMQLAYLAFFDRDLTSAMRAAFWRSILANSDLLGTDNTYTRAGSLIVPITASRVACYGAGQTPPGYAPNAVAADNPLKLGVPCEDGETFQPIGSDNQNGNTADQGTDTHASVDGPSGMRDAVRVLQGGGGAWAIAGNTCYMPTAAVAIVGASNISWLVRATYKRATVGTTARLGFYFSGDAGGPEAIVAISDNATPVDWGSFSGTVTPTRPGQVQYLLMYGANAIGDDCDWAEIAVVKNRATAPLTWRRVGTAAAAQTSTPTLAYTNVGNARYSPAAGKLRARFADFQGKAWPTVGTYATGNQPEEPCYANGSIWIPNWLGNTVTKMNAVTGAVTGTYATGNFPRFCCYDGTNIWVTCDAGTVRKLTEATGAFVGDYACQNNPCGVCFDGTNVWIANRGSNSVTKLVAATGALVGNYATGGNAPRGICYDQATNTVWTANGTGNNVTKFNAATGAAIGTYASGGTVPVGICSDGTNIWCANAGSDNVTKFTAATGAVVGTYAAGTNTYWIMFDGTYIWTTNQVGNSLTRLLASTGARVADYGLPAGSVTNGLCYDGNYVWACNGGLDTITKLGSRPTFLAYGAEGGQGALWLDYSGDQTFLPLTGVAPQLRLRLWDDAAALVSDLDCGALTTAEMDAHIEWDSTAGTISVRDGAGTLLASRTGAAWVPEAGDVAPLYVGSEPAGANAARCLIELLENY